MCIRDRHPTEGQSHPIKKDKMSDSTKPTDGNEEQKEYLRAIWQELNIGKSGYITASELFIVCQHLEMDYLNENVIFDKLLISHPPPNNTSHIIINNYHEKKSGTCLKFCIIISSIGKRT